MAIGKIIRQLLDERKRVILPGFGNMEIKESGGGFPVSGKKIDPPGLTIKFESSYSNDDGLLASTLAREEQIDPEEAGQQVLELVDAIKFELDKGVSYTLDEAGSFSRDNDGKVHFQPQPGWVLEPDQYGLESMELLELEDLPEEEPIPEKQEPAIPSEPVRPKAKATSKPPVINEPWKNEKPRRRFSGWRVIWMVAGVLIVVLVVLILMPAERMNLFWNREGTEQQIQSEEPAAGQETTDQAGSDESRPAAGPEKPAGEEAEKPADQGQTGPVEVPAETHSFFIIAGSFKHLGNASELQDKLKTRGYPSEVMVTENRMYRVSVASYASKAEAEKALAGIKSERGLESCWLLSNR